MKTNRSEFVRSMPNAKPAEVVEAAHRSGIKLSRGLVYAVRAADRRATPARAPRAARRADSVEQRFADVVLEIGLARSEALLSSVRAAARASLSA